MGSSRSLISATALCCLLLTRCSSSPDSRAELLENNRRLTQEVSDRDSEVKRLERVLSEQRDEPSGLTGETLAVAPQLPLTVLKPPVSVPSPSEEEPASNDQAVASSEHEVLAFYRQGLDLKDAGQHDAAIRAFRQFLAQAPDHVYADRAHYWIGQCYFLSREYGLALTMQNRLLAEYPFSVRAPEALYGAALSNLALGQKAAALGLMRDFLRQYPAQSISQTVSRKLAELSTPRR